jgi:hypothetical protein
MRYPWNLPRSLPALIFLAIFALQSSPNALAQTQGGGSAATVFLNFYNATQAVIKNPAQEIYASDGTGTFEFMCQTKLVLLESCFLKAPDPPDA